MSTFDRVLLFPGQGSFRDGDLARLANRHPQIRQVFSEIDRVAHGLGAEGPAPHVLASGSRPLERLVIEAPDVLQLAIYGTSIALWTILRDSGQQSGVLAGHSSGEIAALVAAGAYTVAEGAEIVVRRSAVLSGLSSPAGGMLALACDAERARRVIDAIGNPLVAVAVRNGARQVVLSGPADALRVAASVARALNVAATPLTVAYPFHSPMLAGAAPEFAAQIRHIEPRPLRALVFSPILGRFHRADDELGEHVANGLIAPVGFDRALDRLHEAGARVFVECATAGTLARIVQRCLPEVSVMPALTAAGLDATLTSGPRAEAARTPVAALPAPAPAPPAADPRPAVEVALAAAASLPLPAAAGSVAGSAGRDSLLGELVAMYAQALEYPAEVFSEDVKLEEDLGIDSVKQTELMARAAEHYGLPESPQDFRLGDYDTMGKLVDYIWSMGSATLPAATSAAPLPLPLPLPAAAGSVAGSAGRDTLLGELVAMYAQALEYPAEVFSEDVKLEEDLGIDSVKQTELMARAAEHYGLPESPQDFRLGDYDTMGKLVDYIWSMGSATLPAATSAAPLPLPLPLPAAAGSVAGSAGRDTLLGELVAMYAQALEYPAEVFSEDVKLEEDLGIDSVKQTELMARAAEHYGLPESPQDFRLGDYDTMGKLVDYIWSMGSATLPAATSAAPLPLPLPLPA